MTPACLLEWAFAIGLSAAMLISTLSLAVMLVMAAIDIFREDT